MRIDSYIYYMQFSVTGTDGRLTLRGVWKIHREAILHHESTMMAKWNCQTQFVLPTVTPFTPLPWGLVSNPLLSMSIDSA